MRGRKSKYETHVKPYLAEISEWCETLTEEQICKKLGVGTSAWSEYKKEYSELTEAIKKGRQDLVIKLRSALIKKAVGYEYEERKYYTDDSGKKRMEKTVKYSHPDVAAINLALKNYDRDNWSNDPQMQRLREQELELRKKQIESSIW